MSNPNDPYDPTRSQQPWDDTNSSNQDYSNDWNSPQQNYGPDDSNGPLVPQRSLDAGHSGTQLSSDDIVAIVLSAVFPGAGQIMLGQTTKGIVILAVSFVSCCIGGVFNVASAIDAYAVVMAKRKRAVGEWEFFPDLTNKP